MAMRRLQNPKRWMSQITQEIKIKMQLCIFTNKCVTTVTLS